MACEACRAEIAAILRRVVELEKMRIARQPAKLLAEQASVVTLEGLLGIADDIEGVGNADQ